ncbi:MAG: DUF2071 domain-containing protein [Planctomycetota bacterium]
MDDTPTSPEFSLSDAKVVMRQQWRDLLFLHWSFDPAELAATLPEGLTPHTFEGRAYVGVVPFLMRNVRPSWFPAVPGLSHFGELNLRTYAQTADGRTGVWFYSLDAHQAVAVWIARTLFRLPYHRAFIRQEVSGEHRRYFWQRGRPRTPSMQPAFAYDAPSEADCRPAEPGTLDHFLVERYRLWSGGENQERLFHGQVRHTPYRVGPPSLEQWDDRLFGLNGLAPPGRAPDHAAWSPGVDVEVLPLRELRPPDPHG